MAVASSTVASHEMEQHRKKNRREDPLLPLSASPGGEASEEQKQVQLSLELKRAYAQSRSDSHRNQRFNEEGHWHALAATSEDDEDYDDSPRASDLALYDSDGANHQSSTGSLHSFRKSVRRLLDRPESSVAASVIQTVIMSLIVLSTVFAVMETVPSLYQENMAMFKTSEKVFTIIFSVEVLARALTTDSLRKYFCSLSNQIDILATSPWYAEKILVATLPEGGDSTHLAKMAGSLRTLRMVRLARLVRLFRVLRIAKFARHSEVLTVVLESLAESVSGIFVLMAFVGMWSLISATCVYAAESERPNTDFESIPAALWWSMATISTVGYGDMVPETVVGKFIGGVSMLGGILITSIAVAVITTTFTEHYQQRVHMLEVDKFTRTKRNSDYTPGGLNGTPMDKSASGRPIDDNPLLQWEALEKDVLMHIAQMEASILDKPLRHRQDASDMALRMLEEQAKQLFKQGTVLTQQIVVAAATAEKLEMAEKTDKAAELKEIQEDRNA